MKNVVAYLRVSTEGQTGEDKFGLQSQRKMIEDYCAGHDLNVQKWFTDEAVSGASDERPALNQIVYGDVTNPPFEAVIVAKSDRIARDIYLYFAYRNELRKKNIELISVTEDFGMFGVYAPILEAMLAAMAQIERQNINMRTMGGRKIKASAGGYSGGKAPVGYCVKDGALVINSDEALIVRRVFALRDAGVTLYDIANTLNSEGFTTRSGKPFWVSSVQSILNNRKTYEGWYKYGKNGEWVRGQHEPILKKTTDKGGDKHGMEDSEHLD